MVNLLKFMSKSKSSKRKTASVSITGAGVVSVNSSDILQSVAGQRQLDALRKIIEADKELTQSR